MGPLPPKLKILSAPLNSSFAPVLVSEQACNEVFLAASGPNVSTKVDPACLVNPSLLSGVSDFLGVEYFVLVTTHDDCTAQSSPSC